MKHEQKVYIEEQRYNGGEIWSKSCHESSWVVVKFKKIVAKKAMKTCNALTARDTTF